MWAIINWNIDIKFTDFAIILATLAGPFLAVYVTEKQRKAAEIRNRKMHIFRNLMATRSASLSQPHIESLNLVEVEFDHDKQPDKEVVDRWRLYLAHLNNRNYPKESWSSHKEELLMELLHSMATALGYSYRRSEIQSGTYYPEGWMNAESETSEIRQRWLSILQGKSKLPMKAEVYNVLPESNSSSPST